ncbi:putative ankyrin repeat domain-containing protein 19 isoform X2 [Dipodomys merriami]|uniref:putative ankyrin repeat domain-containing protein 19 isoform X2 n=1 Tax=Dipodomys merriami TaxID=94247 RepID=UPI0038559BD6
MSGEGRGPGWQRVTAVKKFFGFGARVRTPLGFCDDPPSLRGTKPRELYKLSYKPHSDDMFHWAAVRGDIAHIDRCLAAGFGVNYRERKRRTALHFAAWYGNPDLITFLLEKGCDMNIRDSCGYTPLIKSVQARRLQCLTILLEYGADPNIKDHKGYTAIFYAVFWEWKPVVVKLLEYNAYLEIRNEEGLTPLLFALKENKETIAEFLISNGANINAFDKFQRNTLMYAVRCESAHMIKLLLDRGVDPCFQDAHLWTAKRYAFEGLCKVKHVFLNYEEEKIKYVEEQNQIEAQRTFDDTSLASPCKDTAPCNPGLKETAPNERPPLEPSSDPKEPAPRDPESTSMEDDSHSSGTPSTDMKDSIMNEAQRILEVIPFESDESDFEVIHEEQQRRHHHNRAYTPVYMFQLPGAVYIPEESTFKEPKKACIEKCPHFKPHISYSVVEDATQRMELQPFKSEYLKGYSKGSCCSFI